MRRLLLLAALATLAVASPAGAAWTPAQTLARGDVHDIAVASTDGGLALAAWRVGGRSPSVAVRMRTGGGEWRPVARFRRPGRAFGAPSVAIDARGGAVLAWSESRAGRARRIVAALRSPGGAWRRPRIIGRTGKSFPAPAAAIARTGRPSSCGATTIACRPRSAAPAAPPSPHPASSAAARTSASRMTPPAARTSCTPR